MTLRDPNVHGYARSSLLSARYLIFAPAPATREHVLVWTINGEHVPAGYAACRRCERLIDRFDWAKGCPGKER